MNELHLFAGAGGGILAGQLLGHRTVCAVEWEPYAQAVLVARQNDGTFPPFPIWDDVQTFDGRPWNGIVDIVAGGFPCQDISVAGNGAGLDGERSGMWHHMARIIGEVRPRYVIVENSPALTSRGLGRVLADLAAMGFDAQWGVLGASDVGAPHKRERIWIVAHAAGHACNVGFEFQVQRRRAGQTEQIRLGSGKCGVADTPSLRSQGGNERGSGWEGNTEGPQPEPTGTDSSGRGQDVPDSDSDSVQGLESEPQPSGHGRPARLHDRAPSIQPWPTDPADAPESSVGRVVDGVAHRSHRIKAIGNGQVPRVAAAAWNLLRTA